MKPVPHIMQPLLRDRSSYDDDFFDDMLGLFPDASGYAPKEGMCGKYIYDGNNWTPVIEDNSDYYPSRADDELVSMALDDILEWGIPEGTPYVDLGAGGQVSFRRYALRIMRMLQSREYTGVDFCDHVLREIDDLRPEFRDSIEIKTTKLDLFFPTTRKIVRDRHGLGVMNGLTLGNMGHFRTPDMVRANLIASLKYLSQLCGHGWLLVSIDPNQDKKKLEKAYNTPALQKLFLSILNRMADELPVSGFDPSLFVYKPDFHPELQLLAHTARATETQDFRLSAYEIHIEKGQKIHLLNSYKFKREFFEGCCLDADLAPVKYWRHETGVMLYLLKDNRCIVSERLPKANAG